MDRKSPGIERIQTELIETERRSLTPKIKTLQYHVSLDETERVNLAQRKKKYL